MKFPSAAQPWLNGIPVMQQSVLFSAIRGPDGFRKHHPVKALLRWYRRCVLISAFDGKTLDNPYDEGGGSFTGPSYDWKTTPGWVDWQTAIKPHTDAFVHARDEMTLHYYAHAMHAFQILGAHHPVPHIRAFWHGVYLRMVNALHLTPEPVDELNRRLGDDKGEWSLKADEAGSCSE